MYITAVDVRGLRDLPRFSLSGLDRRVLLRGPTPATTALGDAIELVFAALSPSRLAVLLRRLGLVDPGAELEITGSPLPEEVAQVDADAARSLLQPGDGRVVQVDLTLALDPPQFGQLREYAAREPRVVTALSASPTIRVGVGALFATSYDALSVSVQRFMVGAESFPVRGGDRPQWVGRILADLCHRFHRYDPDESVAARAMSAATSRTRHDDYRAWCGALEPGGPTLRVARGPGDQVVLLGDDLPLRRHGRAGVIAAGLAAATHLSGADIVWAETDDAGFRGAVDGDASPLEQIWGVWGDGAVEVASDEAPRAVLTTAGRGGPADG